MVGVLGFSYFSQPKLMGFYDLELKLKFYMFHFIIDLKRFTFDVGLHIFLFVIVSVMISKYS